MARRSMTNLERVTTWHGEEFIQNERLMVLMKQLREATLAEFPEDDLTAYFRIRDAASMLSAIEMEKRNEELKAEIARLQALEGKE